jgi:hypothetical protein
MCNCTSENLEIPGSCFARPGMTVCGVKLKLYNIVMPGLVPGIHVFAELAVKKDVDGRDEPGHDGVSCYRPTN